MDEVVAIGPHENLATVWAKIGWFCEAGVEEANVEVHYSDP